MNVFFTELNSHFACNFVFFCDSQKRLEPAEIREKSILLRGEIFLTSHLWGVGWGSITGSCYLTYCVIVVSIIGVVYVTGIY